MHPTYSRGKHLRVIHKGIVPLKGKIGLIFSEEPGYDLKLKILGKGSDRNPHTVSQKSHHL